MFLLSIKMSEKTGKFYDIRVNKKEFHKSKQAINLTLVNVDQIVVSGTFKHSDMVLSILLLSRYVLPYLK